MGFIDEEKIEEKSESNDEEVQESMDDNDNFDWNSLAPSSIDVSEAAESEHIWKVMTWANEGQGKTHFGYTMPEPVCIIDTEHKAKDIAHKFTDKKVKIWEPNDFDEAVDHLEEALSLLSEYKAETGETGTIMIDSMAVMWEWAQYKHIDKYYPDSDPENVNLDIQDWTNIKKIHNKGFRNRMESCDFHIYWTSTRKDDVNSALDDESDLDYTPDKPGGESNNKYKVNSIIRLYLNENKVPLGDLQKSGLLRFKYIGLLRPTFEKHQEIVERVQEIEMNGAETAEEVQQQFDLDYDVRFTEANTMKIRTGE